MSNQTIWDTIYTDDLIGQMIKDLLEVQKVADKLAFGTIRDETIEEFLRKLQLVAQNAGEHIAKMSSVHREMTNLITRVPHWQKILVKIQNEQLKLQKEQRK